MDAAVAEGELSLLKTMVARRNGLRNRLVFAAIYAAAFGPVTGWLPALAWLSAYGALQAFEFWLFAPASAARRFRRTPTLALLALNSTVYGALALVAFANRGAWGLVCGGLFLAGGVLNTVVTNQRSQAAYVASMVPFGGYLMITAAFAWSLSGLSSVGVALGAVGVLLVFSSTVLWRAAADGLEAQRRARREADRRRLEAESLSGAKSTFIAIVSHELRTPISAILAGAEAIARDPRAEPAMRDNAGLIAESGRMMRTLLNDLLDLSKMEAGRMRVEAIPFDLAGLIRDSLGFWSAEAEKKGIELRAEGLEGLPAHVVGDPTRLRQVLNNLFSNAIKFTDQGSITLALSAEREGTSWRLAFHVRDTGQGMTPPQLERLFAPFEQASAATARTHGGTGLGLAISRELARLMGGDLVAQSRPGEGSTFTLQVTLAEAAADQAPGPSAGAEPVPVDDVRVLVVDDHEVNRRAVALMLEPLGVALTSAACAGEALEILARAPFDVVLMDVYMPDLDGREAVRRLRAQPGPNRTTPVIACTASAADADLDECRAAGMTAVVAKPIDPAALHGAIAEVLSVSTAAAARAA